MQTCHSQLGLKFLIISYSLTNTIIGNIPHKLSMHTRFLIIPPHSFPSKRPFPKVNAHSQVRAPTPLFPPSSLMANRRCFSFSIRSNSSLLLLTIFLHFVASLSQSDADVLLEFKKSLKNTGALSNWDKAKPPCNGDNTYWRGVLCDKGTIYGMQLENMGLSGEINIDVLANLKDLRTISFMNNGFEGPLPNFTRLGALKMIYLSNNEFSGEIPDNSFTGMLSLKKLYLANNKLSGAIPDSMASLPKLMELMLENNSFEGELPYFGQDTLSAFNVSNNELAGEIPPGLSRFNATSFNGNKDLCGSPLEPCTKSRLSKGTIILIIALVAVALLALILAVVILRCRKRKPQDQDNDVRNKSTNEDLDVMEQGRTAASSSSPPERSKKPEANAKLTFLRDDIESFEMSELLQASADILGNGVFGSSYKAELKDGKAMVVKRCKHMNHVSREDFNEHMRRLGRLRHENVLPIMAFYYRKEEKLLVADFVENLSLDVHLHVAESRSLPCLDWPTRLNIVKGIARGLLHLHNELPTLTVPHGHLKSSNVVLDRSFKPLLTDYGLIPVVNQEQARSNLICYRSPEYGLSQSVTKKTDVWNLGILILEILTGKNPSCFVEPGGENLSEMDKVEDVFDPEMKGSRQSIGEMKKLLRIGLMCCLRDVDERSEIKEVVEMIEEVKDQIKDVDDEFHSVRSSRLSDDLSSVNVTQM